MDPFTMSLIAAGGSALGGWLGGKGNANKETKMQKRQSKLVDELIRSLSGNGKYSDLFNADEATFQKSFVDPAKALFKNQIAPQIQQQSIAGGQQRGTGLDDQLLRAGVDMDSLLNQYMYQHQQDALNRKQNTIGSILGLGSGAENETSGGQDIMSGLGGFVSSPEFSQGVSSLFKNPKMAKGMQSGASATRKGFENQ